MATKTKPTNGLQTGINQSNPLSLYVQALHQRGQPIALRINGQVELEISDEGSYQKLLELVARIENVNGLKQAFEDIEEGRSMALEDFKEQVRKSHGISH